MTDKEYLKDDALQEVFPYAVVDFHSREVKCLFSKKEYAFDFIDYHVTLDSQEVLVYFPSEFILSKDGVRKVYEDYISY